MSRYHKGYRRGSLNMEQSRYSAYSPGRRLFASNLEALQLLSMKYNFAEQKTRLDTNFSDRQIKTDDNSCTVNRSSLSDVNSNNLEFKSEMKLESIPVIETLTFQKASRINQQEEKRISNAKPIWKSDQGKQNVQSQKLEDTSFSDNIRAYLSGITYTSSEHHSPTCSKSMETKKEGLKQDLATSVLSKQESSSLTQTQVLEINSSLENIMSQSLTGRAASDSVTSSSFRTQFQSQSIIASDTAHHSKYMRLASQLNGDVKFDNHEAVTNPSTKSIRPDSKSSNSFQTSVPSQKISSRFKKDQQRNKEPTCLISSEGKEPANQGAVRRQMTQNIGTRSEPTVSYTASVQNNFEPVDFTVERETCENKVCSADLSIASFIKNKEETRSTEPKNYFHPGNIMLTIPKSNISSVGQMQHKGAKSKKSWDSLAHSRAVKHVKIFSRDPRRHGRLFADNFVQCFSGLESVIQQSDCRVRNHSQAIEDCKGKIEIDTVRKEHLTKAGHFSGFNDNNSLSVKGVKAIGSKKGSNKLVENIYGQKSEKFLPKRHDRIGPRFSNQQSAYEKASIEENKLKVAVSLTRDCSYLEKQSKIERTGTMKDPCRQQNQDRMEIQPLRQITRVTHLNVHGLHFMDLPQQSNLLTSSMNNSGSANVNGNCTSTYARSTLLKDYGYIEKDQGISILQGHSYPGTIHVEERDIERLPKQEQTNAAKAGNKDQVLSIQQKHSYVGLKDVEHKYISRLLEEGQRSAVDTSMKDQVFIFKEQSSHVTKYAKERHTGRLPKEGHGVDKKPADCILDTRKTVTPLEPACDPTQNIKEKRPNKGSGNFNKAVYTPKEMKLFVRHLQAGFAGSNSFNNWKEGDDQAMKHVDKSADKDPSAVRLFDKLPWNKPYERDKHAGNMVQASQFSLKPIKDKTQALLLKDKLNKSDTDHSDKSAEREAETLSSVEGPVKKFSSIVLPCNQAAECNVQFLPHLENFPEIHTVSSHHIPALKDVLITSAAFNSSKEYIPSSVTYNIRNTQALSHTDKTNVGNAIEATYFENYHKSNAQSVLSIDNPIRRDASAVLPSNNFQVTDMLSIITLSERCAEIPPTLISARSDWKPVPAVSQLPVDRIPTHSLMKDEAKIIDREIAQGQEKFLDVDKYSVADVFVTDEDPENYKCLSEVLQSKNSTLNTGCKDGIPHKNTFMNDQQKFSSGKMDQAIFILKENNYPAVNDMGQSHRSRLLQKVQTDSARISHMICTMDPREQTDVSEFFYDKQIIDQGEQDNESEKLENKLPCASYIQSETKDMPVREGSAMATLYKSLPAVAAICKSLESNIPATQVTESVTKVNNHALPSFACMFIDTKSKLVPPMDSLKRDTVLVTDMYNSCHRNASVVPTTTEKNMPHVNNSVDVSSVICADKSTKCGFEATSPMINSSDKNGKVVPSVKISREIVPSHENSYKQNVQLVSSCNNSHEQNAQPVPSCDNFHEQNAQPMPSVDTSSVIDVHALPLLDTSSNRIEQVPLFPENSEISQGHEIMETGEQIFNSFNKDKKVHLSKSLQSLYMNTALNIQPVQPYCSDFSSFEMQDSSKPGCEQTAVDYGNTGEKYDIDVYGNLQPNSLEQNSLGTEKNIPLFPVDAFSLDNKDSFDLDEIIYHPTADLVWEGDAACIFQSQSTPSKKNHKDRGNISSSLTKAITLMNEDKCHTLGMTQLCRGSTLNNSERNIRNLSQPPEFAGLVENERTLEAKTVSKEILLDKVNDVSHNCMMEINKDNKNSEKGKESDMDFIRDILFQMDKTHDKDNYSLLEKTPIETVLKNCHATQIYCSCSDSNGKTSSTITKNLSAEKGSKRSISRTRQNVSITDVLLLEAKKFIRSDTVTGNRSGFNRTRLETSSKRSSRLLLKQLKASPRKLERKTIGKTKAPCMSRRKGTRRKGTEKQLNKGNGSDLEKETCEKAAIATEEKKANRESSIITDFSVKTYHCEDIKSHTEKFLPQIKIPEKTSEYHKTDLEKQDGDKTKYGAQRRNKLAKLTEDAYNADNGESSNGSQSSNTFKHYSKTEKIDADIILTKNAFHENQMEKITNVEGRNEALSLVAKLKERIEKPNQVCPFDDDVNLRDYVSEVRIAKQDTDLVSDKFFSKPRKKRHLGAEENSKSKRSRWCFKAGCLEQLRFGKERKKCIGKNFKRKLKGCHCNEDSEMTITFLKTASGETEIKSKVSEQNETTRGTPHKQTMKKLRTKLVFSREEFEKSKKERRLKQCVYCGEVNKEHLHMIHIKKVHPYRCAHCQKTFQSKKFKWEHHLQTHVQQTYPCGPCDRKFISKLVLERHLASAAHRHRISDILFQQVAKKSSHSKDTIGLLTEAKTSSEMDVSGDIGSFCDASSIAEFVRQHKEQSLILSLIQDQMMLGSEVDVTNLVMEQTNVHSQQPSNLLNSNHAGVRVFTDTNVAWMNAYQHYSQTSPDLNISSLNKALNSHSDSIPRNDSSTYTQIGAGHGSAELTTAICTSNYKSCSGNNKLGEHGSTGQELMHYETFHPGQGPINTSSGLNNNQNSAMVSSGWLSTAVNVMADDSISHDTEYNSWLDQSLPKVSTKHTYSNLQGVSISPHQSGSDCHNFNQLSSQSGNDCLDSILAAQQSNCVLDCKQSCINRIISENMESMHKFNSPCSTGIEARSSYPQSVANTLSPDFGPVQCLYTSGNQHFIEQDAAALNLNAVNSESVVTSCEPTTFCSNKNSNQPCNTNNSMVPQNKPDQSTMSSKGGCNLKALMELDPCLTCGTSKAPIYVNCLSNGHHGTSLVASLLETPQSIQIPCSSYRVLSEENGVNIESEGRLREQLNQILCDIELSEQQAQQF
ncbi:hypothetical protein CHS0354_040052 [Potamilus streckersoni]|uniref:C2H2-type domain-containing protein n=1 Tax=Potamilus streckersoni TaxID=2493646 RepID=A0AAE0W257_9BIVA|nr:hypothetical protein CHS0354_040052 [Potamilus streckersoni]